MRRKRYKLKHYEMGLCMNCPRKTTPGLTLCPECLYKKGVYAKKYRQKNIELVLEKGRKKKQARKDKGLCPDCGNERDNPDRITCQNCRERIFYEV